MRAVKEILNIRKSVYGNYNGGNYGAHCIRLDIGRLSVWFSYDTIVAIQNGETYVSKNCWSTTTGKHLNAIDGGDRDAKKRRLPRKEFEAKVAEILKAHNLSL